MTPQRQEQYHEYFMKVAEVTAQLSYARRTKVGALIVLDNRILT
jgi:dCMP deaminase